MSISRYFYILRRGTPENSKLQPNRFLSEKDVRDHLLIGSTNLLMGFILWGICATFVVNNCAATKIYHDVSEHGWMYLIASTVVAFLMQEASGYYIHRMLHIPFFYKRYHKIHHKYNSPIVFGAFAVHPVEFLLFLANVHLPIFLIPLHYTSFFSCVAYVVYYSMIDHSGVEFESILPWQPHSSFHDNHHKYFHANFGINTLLFDRYYDTLRKETRIYSEDIFGGKGKEEINTELEMQEQIN